MFCTSRYRAAMVRHGAVRLCGTRLGMLSAASAGLGSIASPELAPCIATGIPPLHAVRWAATAPSVTEAAATEAAAEVDSPDYACLIGVGWNRTAVAGDEQTSYAGEVSFFCARTKRTLTLPIPEAAKRPMPKVVDPDVVAMRAAIKTFCDVSFNHLHADTQEEASKVSPFPAVAVFLCCQNDATAIALQQVLTMAPDARGSAGSLAVRAHYMCPTKDAWSMLYGFFVEQRRSIKNLPLPRSLFDAYTLVSSSADVPTESTPESARWAIMAVKAPMAAALRFGGPSSFLDATTVSQEGQVASAVVARVLPRVRFFTLSLKQKAVSVTDRFQLRASVYHGSKKQTKNLELTSLADEKKIEEIRKMLCRASTLTVLLPTPDTSPTVVQSLLRNLKMTNPVYVATEAQLMTAAGIPVVAVGGNPKSAAEYHLDVCDAFPGGQATLLAAATMFARERFRATSGVMSRIAGLVPQQASPTVAQVLAEATAATRSKWDEVSPSNAAQPVVSVPTTSLPPQSAPMSARATTATVDPTVGGDSMPVAKHIRTKQLLDEWNGKIYANPSRAALEQAALDKIQRWIVMDLETTTRIEYKRRANPFSPFNRVVLPGFLDYKGSMVMPPQYLKSRQDFKLPDLSDYQVIVGHNIKFDLHYAWKDPELVKFFERGGLVWDTMYGEYLLSGHYLKLGRGAGLEDVARSYGGTTPKLDAVKQAWAAGKDTTEIDYSVLSEYLEGDLKNTALIFEKQRTRAFINRQVQIINARMDSLLCTTEMEFNGLRIDRQLAVKQERDLENKCIALKKVMDDMIPPEVPRYLRRQFNWSSLPMLSNVIYGGTIEFNVLEQRVSPRSSVKLVSGLSDVSVPSQLAWLANNLGPKIVKTFTELYLRECGLRTNNVYSDAFDTPTVENKFDLYVYAAATSLDGAFAKYSSTPDAPISAFVGAESAEVKQCSVSQIVFAHMHKKVIFVGNLAGGAAATPAIPNGFKLTSVQGTWSDIRDALREFFLVNSGDGAVLNRRIIALGRRNADYLGDVLRANGLDNKFMSDVRPVTELPSDGVREDEDESDAAGKESTTRAAMVSEPALSLGDDIVVYDHATWHFPDVAAKAAKAAREVAGATPRTAAKAVKPNAKAKIISKATSGAQAKEEETCVLNACGGDLVKQALAFGATLSAVAEGVAADYRKRKAEAVSKGADALPAKRRAEPKRQVAHTSELDRRFEVKGIPVTCYLDRDFETAAPGTPRYAELVALRHIGVILASHDVFMSRLDDEPISTVTLPGRIHTFVPDEAERADLHRKFTSEETGKLQVGEPTLTLMKQKGDKLCETILELRGMEKMLSTYYDEKRTGMMALVHSYDSCIHHELSHNKTSTGRLASQNPNCQNIPKEDKSEIRDLFVSRFSDPSTGQEGVCIEADYSQLEVVTLCALSKDPNMTTDLVNKVDFHCKRVTMMHPHLTYEEVVQKAKKDKIPEFVKMRSQAKVFSFQRQYGAGVKMLSESTGLSPDVIKKLIENEAKTYAGVEQFYDMVTLSCNTFDASLQDGARNKHGDVIFKGAFAALSGSRYVFTESDMPKGMLDAMRSRSYSSAQPIKTTTFSPTHLKNYPVQGFAGEIVQVMLGRLWRHFVANRNYGGRALLTNTVHDCVWVDAEKEMTLQVARDVDRIMSSARTVLNEMFPEMEVVVEFPVDVVAGPSMGHVKGVKGLKN